MLQCFPADLAQLGNCCPHLINYVSSNVVVRAKLDPAKNIHTTCAAARGIVKKERMRQNRLLHQLPLEGRKIKLPNVSVVCSSVVTSSHDNLGALVGLVLHA